MTYAEIIVGIGVLTIIYTYIGGIKAVVWMDVVQMLVYVGGAIWAVFILLDAIPGNWWQTVSEAGKNNWLSGGGSTPYLNGSPSRIPS